METPESVSEFLAYLHDKDATEPELSFPARAVMNEKLPRFFSSVPAGEVYLYDSFVVFLTLDDGPAGTGLMWKQFAQQMGSQLKQIHMAYKAATNPGSLLFGAAKWLVKQFQDEDGFANAIMNPNSLFIPLGDVKSIETGCKWSQGNFIQVVTCNKTVFLCQNIVDQSDNLVDLWQVGRSMFTKKWQPSFVDRLVERIERNHSAEAA